jgi:hypothetical protein
VSGSNRTQRECSIVVLVHALEGWRSALASPTSPNSAT